MKKACVLLASVLAISCTTERDIQVQMTRLRLIKVDTVYRNDQDQKVLIWQTPNKVTYYSFEDINEDVPIGTSVPMMMKK